MHPKLFVHGRGYAEFEHESPHEAAFEAGYHAAMEEMGYYDGIHFRDEDGEYDHREEYGHRDYGDHRYMHLRRGVPGTGPSARTRRRYRRRRY